MILIPYQQCYFKKIVICIRKGLESDYWGGGGANGSDMDRKHCLKLAGRDPSCTQWRSITMNTSTYFCIYEVLMESL